MKVLEAGKGGLGGGRKGGREDGGRREDRKVQELGNCPFEDTADDCTELNQRIRRGEDAEKRGVSLVGHSLNFCLELLEIVKETTLYFRRMTT